MAARAPEAISAAQPDGALVTDAAPRELVARAPEALAAARRDEAPVAYAAPREVAARAPAVVTTPLSPRPLRSGSAQSGRMPTVLAAADGPAPPSVQAIATGVAPVELSLAAIRPLERSRPMLAPAMLLQPAVVRLESRQRPFYKKPWFVSVMAVAATGVAAGVTAAVATSALSSHGTSTTSQPLRL
jgi:hypothetical protein